MTEARKQPAWKILRSIPFFGPIRSALLLAIIITPFRFRTKRALWPYAGLAVVTRSSSDHEIDGALLRRRRRAPLTRGLNRNHNRILKSVFKGAAAAGASKPGPLRDLFEASVARGVRSELAMVTLARKIASVTLTLPFRGPVRVAQARSYFPVQNSRYQESRFRRGGGGLVAKLVIS